MRHRLESIPKHVHPIPITRFRSFRTQPLDNLSAAVKLPIKQRFLGNPTLGTDLVRENIVMGTGCVPLLLRRSRVQQCVNACLADPKDPCRPHPQQPRHQLPGDRGKGKAHAGVCEQTHSFYRSLSPAIQQQKPLSSP